jgi:hypothetical protein
MRDAEPQAVVKTGSFRWHPIFWLIAATILFAVEAGFTSFYGEGIPRSTEWLWMFTLGFYLMPMVVSIVTCLECE